VAHPASERTTFADTFDNNRIDGWTSFDEGTRSGPSSWRASVHRLRDTSGVFGGSTARAAIAKPGTVLYAGNRDWSDYDFSISAYSPDDDAIGAVFRFQDRNNYYRFSMDHQRHYRRLVTKVDGHYAVLAQSSRGYTPKRWHRLRIVTTGDRIQVFLNGRRIFDVVDGTHARGRVGAYTWASSATVFDDVSVETAGRDPFTIAVVPDTQFASAKHPEVLQQQMRWLAASRGRLNMVAVLQLGDIVNVTSATRQWATARTYYGYLDGKVPFVAAAGNHDQQDQTPREPPNTKDPGPYNTFLRSFSDYHLDGVYVADDYRNGYRLFTAGGVELMVLNLDYGSPDDVLAWAGQVVDAYPSRHVVVITHDYLGTDNTWRGVTDLTDRTLPHNQDPSLNDGIDVWNEFVRRHQNVQIVLNGHDIHPVSETEPWAAGRLVSDNDAGRKVYQMLSNYQSVEPGGAGYLRLLTFRPEAGQVSVATYSPYLQGSLTDDRNQFTLDGVDLGSWAP
jgi:hypothetical protein